MKSLCRQGRRPRSSLSAEREVFAETCGEQRRALSVRSRHKETMQVCPAVQRQQSLSPDSLKGLETSPWRPILFYTSNKHNFVYLVRDNRSWYKFFTLKYCGIFEWRISSNLISDVPLLFNVIIFICQLHTYMYLHTHIYTHAFSSVLPLMCTVKSTMFIQILS